MSDVTPNSAPMGGTELILGHLKTALPELTDQVQIMCSRPEQYEFDPLKPKILWLQDLPQDPASACLKDATYRSQFNKIVFVSHWQQQMYNAYLGIPYHEGVVIKNAVPFIPTTPKKLYVPCGNDEQQCDAACKATHQKEKLRFVYTSTPHRGLVILAAAAEALAAQRQDWQLDVYSSLNIYGLHEADKQFDRTLRTSEDESVHQLPRLAAERRRSSSPSGRSRVRLSKPSTWKRPAWLYRKQ
jgi:UDP-glucose:(glucosyl)LPS alpha-1,2-glucosyltransferase